MEEKIIKSLSDYHNLVSIYNFPLYRGVSDSDYKLIPKIGRRWNLSSELLIGIEQMMLDKFKSGAYRHLEKIPKSNLEWLTIAQHYGANTRLLDWTTNPLVALYFACRVNDKSHGSVYCSGQPKKLEKKYFENPFSVEGVWYVEPVISSERISNQRSIFTISEKTLDELTEGVVLKIIIDSSFKKIIISQLNTYGISEISLFPGIEGAARESNFVYDLFYPVKNENKLRELMAKLDEENNKLFQNTNTKE